jgi:methylated-DNA-protein-cysteine methyltransferase-like protein
MAAGKRAQRKRTRPVTARAGKGKPRARKPAAVTSPQNLEARILAAVRRIPRGRVSTYGDVAHVAGLPRRARLVGTVLRQSPAERGLPWFRVINASGRSSLPEGSDAQRRQWRLLEAEGVEVRKGRVDLRCYGWPSRERQLDELLWKI